MQTVKNSRLLEVKCIEWKETYEGFAFIANIIAGQIIVIALISRCKFVVPSQYPLQTNVVGFTG